MPGIKRARRSEEETTAKDITEDQLSDGEASGSGESASDSEADSLATEEEILDSQRQVKSKKTQKRKRRATSPSRFGSTLLSLLDTDTPAAVPLALKRSVEKRRAQDVSDAQSKKASDIERKEREEKGHIQDVIGGWGGERERSLRKVAQRGVVRLFNAIQQSQNAAVAAQEEAKSSKGSGKPHLPAPTFDHKTKKKTPQGSIANTKNEMNQDAFLQMIKSGGIVSRT